MLLAFVHLLLMLTTWLFRFRMVFNMLCLAVCRRVNKFVNEHQWVRGMCLVYPLNALFGKLAPFSDMTGGRDFKKRTQIHASCLMMQPFVLQDDWRIACSFTYHGEILVAVLSHPCKEPFILENDEIRLRISGMVLLTDHLI